MGQYVGPEDYFRNATIRLHQRCSFRNIRMLFLSTSFPEWSPEKKCCLLRQTGVMCNSARTLCRFGLAKD
jgi:hypothetical protein